MANKKTDLTLGIIVVVIAALNLLGLIGLFGTIGITNKFFNIVLLVIGVYMIWVNK